MPIVSVIVPVYNAEQYLEGCIKSLLFQTLSDIEIIIVNDGSTDLSSEICKKYLLVDSRIKYIEQKNQGVSIARNQGKKVANGEFVIFVDADDEIAENMLEKLYNDAISNDADIAICSIQRISDKSEVVEIDSTVSEITIYDKVDALKCYLVESKFEIGVWNKLFRKTLIDSIEFYSGKKMNEDKFFAFEAICSSKRVIFRNEGLYYYYERIGSVSKKDFFETKWFDNIFFSEKIYKNVVENYPNLEPYARYQDIMTKYCLITKMTEMKAYREFSKEYHQLVAYIKAINIKDINIKKSSRYGIILIKYCVSLFKLVKG